MILVASGDSVTSQSIPGGGVARSVSGSPERRRPRRLSPACSGLTNVSRSLVESARGRRRERDRYSACLRALLKCGGVIRTKSFPILARKRTGYRSGESEIPESRARTTAVNSSRLRTSLHIGTIRPCVRIAIPLLKSRVTDRLPNSITPPSPRNAIAMSGSTKKSQSRLGVNS